MRRTILLVAAVGVALLVAGGLAVVSSLGPSVSSVASAQTSPPVETLSGTFHVIWGDPLPSSDLSTKPVFVVDDAQGPWEKLLLDNQDAKPLGGPLAINGDQVVVKGARVDDDHVRVESIQVADAEKREPSLEASQLAVTGSQPWVTIACRFADSTGVTPQPKSYFDGLTGTTEPGMDHFWREVSFNNINLTGSQVVDWQNLPQPRSAYFDALGNANLHLLAQDCTAAADADVFFPNFYGINLMFNQELDGFAWGGGTTLTRDGQSSSYSMTWMPPLGFNKQYVVAHEMGHGFGLPHSSGPYNTPYDSDWDPMSQGGTCSVADATYGCLGDHTISFHKDILGWIPSSRKYVAASNSDQTITLERLGVATTTSDYLMAQIPIAGSTTEFYTVEARRFAGYDNTGPIPGEAVVIHKVNTTLGDRLAQVVDPDANGNPNDASAMWLPGETFTDSANGISVEVTGSTTSGYTVRIQNGGTTAPPNDNIANAQGLTGANATVSGTNVNATKESGEPNHAGNTGGKSVWYKWTPQASGAATIDTAGSNFDTLLAVYTGGAVNSLTHVASNDDDSALGLQSKVSFTANAGTTYQIAVDGYGAAMGNINLRLASTSTPSCTKTGTANAETISGTSGADVICAGGGNDTVKGLGGNDILKGQDGNDKLLGGVGDDTLDGDIGTDTASYSASLTAVNASLATNSSTGEGTDTFVGVEKLLGSSKADTLIGSATNNTLTGGGGGDTERGGAGNDKVVGSGGADFLYGEDGADAVNSKDGVNGNDSLDGGAGTDTKVTDTTEKSIVGFP